MTDSEKLSWLIEQLQALNAFDIHAEIEGNSYGTKHAVMEREYHSDGEYIEAWDIDRLLVLLKEL